MTKEEKSKINKAIELLANNKWDEGMDILLHLVDRGGTPKAEKTMTILEYTQNPPTE